MSDWHKLSAPSALRTLHVAVPLVGLSDFESALIENIHGLNREIKLSEKLEEWFRLPDLINGQRPMYLS
jgi:hypothetical protein